MFRVCAPTVTAADFSLTGFPKSRTFSNVTSSTLRRSSAPTTHISPPKRSAFPVTSMSLNTHAERRPEAVYFRPPTPQTIGLAKTSTVW